MLYVSLLTSKEIQAFITKVFKEKWDSLKISAALGKSFSEEERRAIMDYIPLVKKFREKFDFQAFLLWQRRVFPQLHLRQLDLPFACQVHL